MEQVGDTSVNTWVCDVSCISHQWNILMLSYFGKVMKSEPGHRTLTLCCCCNKYFKRRGFRLKLKSWIADAFQLVCLLSTWIKACSDVIGQTGKRKSTDSVYSHEEDFVDLNFSLWAEKAKYWTFSHWYIDEGYKPLCNQASHDSDVFMKPLRGENVFQCTREMHYGMTAIAQSCTELVWPQID